MKFLFTLLLLTLVVNASYIRSIRVTSFLEKNRAKQEIIKLQEFVQAHNNLKKLEKKLDFKYTIHTIDKYYFIVLEPLTDKAAVQEILDTLRVKYKQAYPRKLKTMPKFFQEIEKKVIPLAQPIEVENISTFTKQEKQGQEEETEETQAKEEETNLSQNISAKPQDNTSITTDNSDFNPPTEDISSLLIVVISLLLVVAFLYIYFSRKKSKKVHSKTLTQIVLEKNDELKLQNKNIQSVQNIQVHIKYQELNTTAGLNSFNDDLISYQNSLKNFKEKYSNSAILLENLCNNSNYSQALEIIAQLKEESSQIGASNLLQSIKAMEKEIQLGENAQWEKSIWTYGITLQNLLTDINHYLN